jgi:hypothetical protein
MAYPKVCQRELGIFSFTLEQDVLGFEIYIISLQATTRQFELTSMDDTLIVQVFDCTGHCSNYILGIPTHISISHIDPKGWHLTSRNNFPWRRSYRTVPRRYKGQTQA